MAATPFVSMLVKMEAVVMKESSPMLTYVADGHDSAPVSLTPPVETVRPAAPDIARDPAIADTPVPCTVRTPPVPACVKELPDTVPRADVIDPLTLALPSTVSAVPPVPPIVTVSKELPMLIAVVADPVARLSVVALSAIVIVVSGAPIVLVIRDPAVTAAVEEIVVAEIAPLAVIAAVVKPAAPNVPDPPFTVSTPVNVTSLVVNPVMPNDPTPPPTVIEPLSVASLVAKPELPRDPKDPPLPTVSPFEIAIDPAVIVFAATASPVIVPTTASASLPGEFTIILSNTPVALVIIVDASIVVALKVLTLIELPVNALAATVPLVVSDPTTACPDAVNVAV